MEGLTRLQGFYQALPHPPSISRDGRACHVIDHNERYAGHGTVTEMKTRNRGVRVIDAGVADERVACMLRKLFVSVDRHSDGGPVGPKQAFQQDDVHPRRKVGHE